MTAPETVLSAETARLTRSQSFTFTLPVVVGLGPGCAPGPYPLAYTATYSLDFNIGNHFLGCGGLDPLWSLLSPDNSILYVSGVPPPPARLVLEGASVTPSRVEPGGSAGLNVQLQGENMLQGVLVSLDVITGAGNPACVRASLQGPLPRNFVWPTGSVHQTVAFSITVPPDACTGTISFSPHIRNINGPYTISQPPFLTVPLTVAVPGISVSPGELAIATGGVAPDGNVISVTLTNHPSNNTLTFTPRLINNRDLGGEMDARLEITMDNQNRRGTITALPHNPSGHSASGVFDVGVRSQLVSLEQSVRVTVPPQRLIQVIYGESLQQGPNAKIGLSAVIRNRVTDSAFPNTYNGVITSSQFDSVGRNPFNQAFMRSSVPAMFVSDYDVDVKTAADVFDTSQADITGGSLFFLSPTATQMQEVNAAIAAVGNGRLDPGEDRNGNGRLDPGEDTGAFPPSIARLNLFANTNAWQIVVVTRIETNTRTDDIRYSGQPAFIFFRSRQSTDPVAVRLP